MVTSAFALSLLVGCASGEAPEPPKRANSSETVEPEPEPADLSPALLRAEDLNELAAKYGEFEQLDLPSTSSESMIDGAEECAAYLDSEYGAKAISKAQTAFRAEYEIEGEEYPGYYRCYLCSAGVGQH